MSDNARAPCRVLFLCTGNSARSIMAEAILNSIGPPRFQACSAGSHPKGIVHPEALRLLKGRGYDTASLHSKSWNAFADGAAFDHVVTVCSKAAGAACPVFPGRPARAHWDIPDPTSADSLRVEAAFRETYDMLLEQVMAFTLAASRAAASCSSQ